MISLTSLLVITIIIITNIFHCHGLIKSSLLKYNTINSNSNSNNKRKLLSSNNIDTYIDSNTNTIESIENIESIEGIEDTLKILQEQKEKKKLEILACDIAIRNLENELREKLISASNISKPILTGTYDYGFSSKSTGSQIIGATSVKGSTVPPSAIFLAIDNFKRELRELVTFNEKSNDVNKDDVRAKLKLLTLSNDAIWKRKENRPEVKAPYIIKLPYLFLCNLLDVLFQGRPINRFYFLETVARMPYFSYILMLHVYETLGWWRRSTEAKRVHFAEEYNEFHHLLIWEALGGDQIWFVRFVAQHCAVLYFFGLSILWLVSPSMSYNFSELIEMHAVDTYAQFAEENRELLQSLAPPPVAKLYYEAYDHYIFDEFQTASSSGIPRRPKVNTLYDVICNIRDDEREHSNTMKQCQDPNIVVTSPNTEAAVAAAAAAAAAVSLIVSGQFGDIPYEELGSILSSTSKAATTFDELDVNIEELSESSLPMLKQLLNILKNVRL